MKKPLSYYGGKQKLASKIISLIPPHTIYCEPFMGGGAVFFAKTPSTVEIINDINSAVINFYHVLQKEFPALQKEIQASVHSRKMHEHANVIINYPELFSSVKRAWAIWTLANCSFGCILDAGFGYDKNGTTTKKIENKKKNFKQELSKRIENLQIECCDALRIIRSRDSIETFFYIDPPYVGSDMGHYDGYSQDDFERLLNELGKISGKFLLSSFRNAALSTAKEKYGWHQIEINMAKPMSAQTGITKRKIEVLTANYPIRLLNPSGGGGG